jgi:hypothetical protein
MSGCGRIIKVADDFVDFLVSDHIIVGDWVVVSFHDISWERWSGFCLWWEEGVSEDVAFSLEVVYAV